MITLDIRALALAQRLAIWGALAGFIGLVTHPYVSLAAIILMLYCAWRILRAGQFGMPATVLWLVLMLIPLVNVLALVLLSNRAALKLQAAGVRVGLLGVNARDLPA
jgi:hypothetical protein